MTDRHQGPATSTNDLGDTSLVPAVRSLAAQDSAAPAVHDDSGTLSRGQLCQWAAGIAAGLTEQGVRPGDAVLVATTHGAPTLAACLGTLWAGAVYAVADPQWPSARIARIAGLSGASAALVSPVSAPSLPIPAIEVGGRPSGGTGIDPVDVPADQDAYVLFTSGSTGVPKGVVQTHRGVRLCAGNQRSSLGLTPTDRLSLLTPFCYDMAAVDLWSALLSGACLVTYDLARHGLLDLPKALIDSATTVYHSTPTVLRSLATQVGHRPMFPAVRTVLLGGEPVTGRDVRVAREIFGTDCDLVVGYGSTEASFSAHHRPGTATMGESEIAPIGRALPGFTLTLGPVEASGAGELMVRSPGVARGYLGSPELTAERFTDHPDGSRSFRTGDLASRRPDGTLWPAGRVDRQLKIRGHRLEPAEVEGVLAGVDGVAEAVVIIEQHGQAEPVLIACLQPEPGRSIEIEVARDRVRRLLPSPAHPSGYRIVTALPRTASGKTDRDAIAASASDPTGETPVDEVQRTVRDVVRSVLVLPAVAMDDTFFDLGANSLQLAQIHAALPREAGLDLVDLVSYPTVRSLAERVRNGAGRVGRRRAVRR